MDIGTKIKKLRLACGLTQEDLAIAANTTKQTIHKYETGIITNIPASKIKAIADKLNVTPAYLMGWKEEEIGQPYFLDNEAKEIAQEIANNPDLHILFDATRKVSKKDLQFVIDLVKRLDKKDSGDY